ncbi:MAG: NAD(P)/FAD-dependent oxidoreductase [Leucobacter sp.]
MPRIVILGAGHAGVQLADSLREEGFDGELLLLSEEQQLPYQRPPLTKDFLSDPEHAELMPLRAEDFFAKRSIDLRLGSVVTGIDLGQRLVMMADGSSIGYDDLVFATGSRARAHSQCAEQSAVAHTIRSAEDAARFGARLDQAASLAIVGAGFIGLEVAAAARKRGIDISIISAQPPLARMSSPALSDFLLQAHRDRGSQFVFDSALSVEETAGTGRGVVVCASAGPIEADMVLVAIGAVPNAELAEEAGLSVSNGIEVDQTLRTSDQHVWAIGDVATRCSPDGRMMREESVQSATHHARCLAKTLTGTPTVPTEVPWFWSNQGDLRIQIVGIPDAIAHTVTRGDPGSGRFSVFSFAAGRLCAVESVNNAADHMSARRLLGANAPLLAEQAADLDFDLKAYSLESARITS